MPQQMTGSIIVNGEAKQVYGSCTDPNHIPRFVNPVDSVETTRDDPDTWRMVARNGGDDDNLLRWSIRTTRHDAPHRFAWNTIDGDLKTSGQITCTPLPDKQTEVSVTVNVVSPEAKDTGDGDLEGTFQTALRNLKAYLENREHRMKP